MAYRKKNGYMTAEAGLGWQKLYLLFFVNRDVVFNRWAATAIRELQRQQRRDWSRTTFALRKTRCLTSVLNPSLQIFLNGKALCSCLPSSLLLSCGLFTGQAGGSGHGNGEAVFHLLNYGWILERPVNTLRSCTGLLPNGQRARDTMESFLA
jgi:hypothetical protein